MSLARGCWTMMTTITFSLLFLSTSLAVPKYLLLETEDDFNGEEEPGQDCKQNLNI